MHPYIWGCYLSDAPKGDMGNLIVYPGSHLALEEHFHTRGPDWFYNSQKGEKRPVGRCKLLDPGLKPPPPRFSKRKI